MKGRLGTYSCIAEHVQAYDDVSIRSAYRDVMGGGSDQGTSPALATVAERLWFQIDADVGVAGKAPLDRPSASSGATAHIDDPPGRSPFSLGCEMMHCERAETSIPPVVILQAGHDIVLAWPHVIPLIVTASMTV